ncbi:plasma alpha-L-fucosidase-like [Ornithodoros turicata]|uniref:plasma alpha-L-fucosidase-like n=1 Tax=Ornithodoros turicata TaxID=34597 RepID=UPI003139EDA5
MACLHRQRYKPEWSSLDTRRLPEWYDDAKIGLIIHWGVYSVPAFENEWFWHSLKNHESHSMQFMKHNFKPDFTYQEFAPMFTAEFFDPQNWVKLFSAAGARYVIITAKHHDGYALWPSKFSPNWNSLDIGPHRDIVGDLANAIRKTTPNVRFGVCYSITEWFHPLRLADKEKGTRLFITHKIKPELIDLIEKYKPEVVWAVGDWEEDESYNRSAEIIAWLYNDSPVRDSVVVNDRWAKGTRNKHGNVWTGDTEMDPATLIPHKWEKAEPLDRYSYGHRRNVSVTDYLTIEELLLVLVETISSNGNLLINVGPDKDGTISPLFQERLLQLGQWLKINGEAVYSSRSWKTPNDPVSSFVWYTASKSGEVVYAFVLHWPPGSELSLGGVQLEEGARIRMLGKDDDIKWVSAGQKIVVHLPTMTIDMLPCQWAWVLKIERNV